MHELFDFLRDLFPASWFDDIHSHYDGLTDGDISQSVHEASTFFNMNDPAAIQESWTTGVFTNMDLTPDDDVLVFSREQMFDMGITDKEGFDLVMTHEGAHRMLQGLHEQTGFDSHQEELCCDYMAGVRAGLNDMNFTKMQLSLADASESETHPAGYARVEAIEKGVEFAHEYMKEHGTAPTFSDCLEHFELDVFDSDIDELHEKASNVERAENHDATTFKGIKICATRHGCTGATNCDYDMSGPVGR